MKYGFNKGNTDRPDAISFMKYDWTRTTIYYNWDRIKQYDSLQLVIGPSFSYAFAEFLLDLLFCWGVGKIKRIWYLKKIYNGVEIFQLAGSKGVFFLCFWPSPASDFWKFWNGKKVFYFFFIIRPGINLQKKKRKYEKNNLVQKWQFVL